VSISWIFDFASASNSRKLAIPIPYRYGRI